MSMPNAERARIPRAKLNHYLLAQEHHEGGSKARLLGALGFNRTNRDELERQHTELAHIGMVNAIVSTIYSIKHVIKGWVIGPSGSRLRLRPIWIIDESSVAPRFVTNYPKGGES